MKFTDDSRQRERRRVLRNAVCPYCRAPLSKETLTKDHVIGRRFVPRGSLSGSWNLLIRACRACNGRKSVLEDRVSAASMHPPLVGQRDERDQALAAEARRKQQGEAGMRADRDLQRFNIEGDLMPGVRMKLELVGPPSTHRSDLEGLAWSHLAAFFYMLTYNDTLGAGAPLPGAFRATEWSARSDWGNDRHRAFMRSVSAWEHRLLLDAAKGFFKAMIRRHPTEQCWAWALEWNTNYRILGFFGDPDLCDQLETGLPVLEVSTIGRTNDGEFRSRLERALCPSDDTLFSSPLDEG